jgi:hypothetical protein
VGPDDKVIPIPQQNVAQSVQRPKEQVVPTQNELLSSRFLPALDDIDTAPLEFFAESALARGESQSPKPSDGFKNLDDIEIDQAFSSAISRSLYQLEARRAEDNLPPIENDSSSDVNKSLLDGRPLYNIRFADGRIIGPFDEHNIWDRFKQNTLKGDESYSLAGSEDFKPLRSKVEFQAAIKVFKSDLNFDPKSVIAQPLTSVSLVTQLLNLAHHLSTGWLIVKNQDQTKVLSFAVGRLFNIRSNQLDTKPIYDEVRELFSWEIGSMWFDKDPIAAGDNNVIGQDVLTLCRSMTRVDNGFSLSRTLAIVGEQARVLQAKPASSWLLPKELLNELETEVLIRAEQGKTIHSTLHELFAFGANEEDALHAIVMTFAIGVIDFLSEEALLRIKTLANQLDSSDFASLLNITSQSDDASVAKALDVLRTQVWEATKTLALRDPLRQQMRERFGRIDELLSDPLERYILLKANELGQDLQANLELRGVLKNEFLEQCVSKGILEKRYLEILPRAEHYYALAPDRIEALSWVLQARYFSAAPNNREPIVYALAKALKKQPQEPALLLAAASIFLDRQDLKRAEQTIAQLETLLVDDDRVTALRQALLHVKSTTNRTIETPPMALVHTLWSTFVTLAMTGLLWLLAVDLGLGKTEILSQEIDDFIWLRTAALLIFSLIGFGVLYRAGPLTFLQRLPYRISAWVLLFSALAGALLGGALSSHSTVHREFGALPISAMLFVVVVDRIYYSGFLANDVFRTLRNRLLGVVIVTVLYSLYHLSFYELLHTPLEQMGMRFIALSVGLSLPLALLQVIFRSVLAPLAFHITWMLSAYFVFHFASGYSIF